MKHQVRLLAGEMSSSDDGISDLRFASGLATLAPRASEAHDGIEVDGNRNDGGDENGDGDFSPSQLLKKADFSEASPLLGSTINDGEGGEHGEHVAHGSAGSDSNGWFLAFACVVGGLGPVVSWNSLFVSETLFSVAFGKSFLGVIGLLQNVPSLAVQLLLIWGERAGWARRWSYRWPTVLPAVAQVGVLSVAAWVVAVIGSGGQSSGLGIGFFQVLLYVMVVVNGISTGLSSGKYFALAAEFPPECMGQMVAGNALGALLPTTLYFGFIFLFGMRGLWQMLLYIIFPAGAVLLLLQIASMAQLGRTQAFRGVLAKNARVEQAREFERCDDGNFIAVTETVRGAKVRDEVPNFQLFGRHLRKTALLSGGVFASMAISLALLSVVAAVPCFQFGLNLSFYLIAAYNLGDFAGRQFASRLEVSNTVLAVLMPARLLFVPLVVAYMGRPFLAQGDAFILVVYFAVAFSNGCALSWGAGNSQLICGFHMKDICPVVGAVSAVSMQLGLVVGVASSFGLMAVAAMLQQAWNASDSSLLSNECVAV
jgi:Nucleoside transporter